jgi:WD40 repeat protein
VNPSALLALLAIAAAASALEFELLWAQMVDDEGQFDVDLPTPQSCENAEFSPDETLIATVAKGDFTTRLLRASDGSLVWSVKESGETECVTFTGDGQFVVNGGENNAVRLRRVADGTEVLTLPVGSRVEGLRFSPGFLPPRHR